MKKKSLDEVARHLTARIMPTVFPKPGEGILLTVSQKDELTAYTHAMISKTLEILMNEGALKL